MHIVITCMFYLDAFKLTFLNNRELFTLLGKLINMLKTRHVNIMATRNNLHNFYKL